MNKQHSKLIRPSTKSVFNEGEQPGKIFSLEVKEFDSMFHDSGKREALNIKVEFIKPNGELAYLYYAPTITWSPKGKLMNLLQDLEAVPNYGEELDFDALIGLHVTVTIENVERGGRVYSNIVRMKKKGANNRALITEQKRASSEELDYLLEVETSNDELGFNELAYDTDVEGFDFDNL